MKNKNTFWYVRQQGKTTGPFLGPVITNNLLLGRLSMQHQACVDRVNWRPIEDIPTLHPAKDIDIHTKITIDERNGFDRRHPSAPPADIQLATRSKERRKPEPEDIIRRRRLHTVLMRKFREQTSPIFWPLALVGLFLGIIISLAIFSPTLLPTSKVDCNAAAGIAINWNNCAKPNISLMNIEMSNAQMRSANLAGANFMNATLSNSDMAYADLSASNLSYAQLQRVNLVGANLKNADLSSADLTNADLSYADLTDANLGGSVIDNVSFDHAIWPNGDICGAKSIGKCIPINP